MNVTFMVPGNTVTCFCLKTPRFCFNETIDYRFSDLGNTVLMDIVLRYITATAINSCN